MARLLLSNPKKGNRVMGLEYLFDRKPTLKASKCSECGASLKPGSEQCAYCGTHFETAESSDMRNILKKSMDKAIREKHIVIDCSHSEMHDGTVTLGTDDSTWNNSDIPIAK